MITERQPGELIAKESQVCGAEQGAVRWGQQERKTIQQKHFVYSEQKMKTKIQTVIINPRHIKIYKTIHIHLLL